MTITKVFLGTLIVGAALTFGFTFATAQVPGSPPKLAEEPVWVKIARFNRERMTVYYDIHATTTDGKFAKGIVLYVMDEPIMSPTDSGDKKLAFSRTASYVVDCKGHLFGLVEVQLYDVVKPYNKDIPFFTKLYDPVVVGELEEGSPLHATFCPKFTT
jgi:hypothetical protein